MLQYVWNSAFETEALKAECNNPPPLSWTVEFYIHILCDGSVGGSRASFLLAGLGRSFKFYCHKPVAGQLTHPEG